MPGKTSTARSGDASQTTTTAEPPVAEPTAVVTDGQPDPASSGTSATTAAGTAADTSAGTSGKSGKVIHMPTSAVARIKRESRDQGRKEAIVELQKTLKAAGFDNVDALVKAAKGKGQASTAATSTGGEGAQNTSGAKRAGDANARERALTDQVRRISQKLTSLIKENKRLQRQLDAKDAEMELRLTATRAGVRDVDYAVEMLHRKVQGKSAEELKGFDESRFFNDELKKTAPYLYGAESQPATTSAGADAAGGAPKPADSTAAAATAAASKMLDARKMPREDYDAWLRKNGLTNPALGW